MINLVDKIEEFDKNYIVYPNGEKIDIMDVEGSLLIDQMHIIDNDNDIDQIKEKLVSDSDEVVKKLEEYRGPVREGLVVISEGYNELEKLQGPVWENITDSRNGDKFIRYGRSVEFI